jgi:hypothetical protein
MRAIGADNGLVHRSKNELAGFTGAAPPDHGLIVDAGASMILGLPGQDARP